MTLIHKFFIDNVYMVLDINSGAVHVIDKITYEILDYYPESGRIDVIKKLNEYYAKEEIIEVIDEIDQLIEKQLLFTPDIYSDIMNNIEKNSVIKALCLHIAHDCNIRCKYCFASQGDFKGQRLMMTQEIGMKAIDYLIANSGKRRNLEVDFFGGEPLMNFEVVKEIVKYARSKEQKYNKNFRFTITTNATLLTDEIRQYINENMDNIVLSIDGNKETNDFMRPSINGKGTYDIILPKIKKMVEERKNKSYYVRGTFTRHNLDFAKDVLHFADQNFKEISIEPVVAEPYQDYALREEDLPTIFEEYEKLAKEYLHRRNSDHSFNFFHFMIDLSQGPCVAKRLSGCGAGHEYIAITPEGDIFPCHQFVGDDAFLMGNVFGGDINREIENNFKNTNVFKKEKCSNCWAKFYCSGGCHANAYNFNNDINIPYDVGCEMEKKRLECALMIQAKLGEEA